MAADVIVVGAGLAGLTAADELHRAGLSVRVVEARARVGGRIMTVQPAGFGERGWLDLGATWHWSNQPRVGALARELGLTTFAQFRHGRGLAEEREGSPPATFPVAPPSPAELRIAGGAQELCFGLADRLPTEAISYATSVVAVADEAGRLTVQVADADGTVSDLGAAFLVVAVPPRLVRQHIDFSPPLPADLLEVMDATPTWMARAVKCVVIYDSPFWRAAGWAGLVFSEVGPLIEVHDACTDDGAVAGLWGFVSEHHAWRDLPTEERVARALDQLGRLFGPEAADPVQYLERDWSNDPNTNDEVVWVRDPLAYGHPLFAQWALGRRLVWAGTETAAENGGHMEGAVASGQRAARMVLAAAGVAGGSGE